MTRQMALLVVLLLPGCATGVPPGSSSPAHGGTPTAAVTQQQSACRLPIGIASSGLTVTPGLPLSGFLAYPIGTFAQDPSSNPVQSPYHGPMFGVTGLLDGPSYDWAASRWLPVQRALISSDGATYAYPELKAPPASSEPASGPRFGPYTGTRIHLVNVASAVDRVIFDSTSNSAVVGYLGGWIYLVDAQPEAGPDSSLYRFDISTGATQELAAPFVSGSSASPIAWRVIGSDAAWGWDQQDRLARLDFRTKSVSFWLTNRGTFGLIGLDQHGMPIVSGNPYGARVVTGPDQTVEIADSSVWVDDAIADVHGIWLLSNHRVYLWTPGAGLSAVGSDAAQNDQADLLAGPCQ